MDKFFVYVRKNGVIISRTRVDSKYHGKVVARRLGLTYDDTHEITVERERVDLEQAA